MRYLQIPQLVQRIGVAAGGNCMYKPVLSSFMMQLTNFLACLPNKLIYPGASDNVTTSIHIWNSLINERQSFYHEIHSLTTKAGSTLVVFAAVLLPLLADDIQWTWPVTPVLGGPYKISLNENLAESFRMTVKSEMMKDPTLFNQTDILNEKFSAQRITSCSAECKHERCTRLLVWEGYVWQFC
jgi:hypothetical protein